MTKGTIVLTKYVFLDIVSYSKGTIEAQCYVIGALNRIVKGAVNKYHVEENSIIYIPTGDGICIAFMGSNIPFDIHITIAKEILRRIHVNNSRVGETWKQFEVRVGINQCDDNVITDINDRENVAGAGINNARRIMDLADASQILVSSSVYENLHPRKKYHHAFSEEYRKEVKHGLVLRPHQFIEKDTTGLNVNIPSIFIVQVEPEPKLTEPAAYYFAHCIKNREHIMSNRESGQNNYALAMLQWYLADDSLRKSNSTLADPYERWMPGTESNTLDELFQVFMNLPIVVCIDFRNHFIDGSFIGPGNFKYFADRYECLIVNDAGKHKLISDWPEIWNEFELDKYIN